MATDTEIRAAEARQLQNNPIFQEVFNNVREELVAQLEATPIDVDSFGQMTGPERRNQLGLALQCLALIKHDIESNIDTVILDAEQDKDSM